MKLKLLPVALFAITSFAFAQQKPLWNVSTKSDIVKLDSKMQVPTNHLLDLDVASLKTSIQNAPERFSDAKTNNTIISLPNESGQMEKFRVYENSNMAPELAAKYPEIKSYIGIGIDNPTSTGYFSVSPLGFKGMILSADKSAVFIEPYSKDLKTYSVYRKSDKNTIIR